jgi:hypothetical protein
LRPYFSLLWFGGPCFSRVRLVIPEFDIEGVARKLRVLEGLAGWWHRDSIKKPPVTAAGWGLRGVVAWGRLAASKKGDKKETN